MGRLGLAVRLGPFSKTGSASPYAAYALALDFKNGAYWKAGAQQASLSAMPGYAYTRSGDKGEVNSTGAVQTFLANVPGIPTGVGYWSRGALTNYVTRSQEFDDAIWIKQTGTSVTANQAIAPDGTMTADLVIGDGSSGIFWNQASVAPNVARTRSVYLKAVTGTPTVVLKDGAATIGTVNCALTSTWQRFVLIETSIGASPWIANIPASGIYVWQGQAIDGNFPDGGPIIVTGAATASTGADALSVSLANGTYANTVYTYADGSTETIPTTVSAGAFTVANPKTKAIALITVNP